jgi:hypothetical protein
MSSKNITNWSLKKDDWINGWSPGQRIEFAHQIIDAPRDPASFADGSKNGLEEPTPPG